jgi:hydroxypyruvate isomerase
MSIKRRAFLQTSAASTTALLAPGLFAGEDSAKDLPQIGRTPHTKFAVNVEMWFTRFPFLERIRRAAALGFPAVEIWSLAGRNVAEIAAVANGAGVEISQFTAWGFTPGMNEVRNHSAVVQAIKDSCAAAKTLKSDKACVVAGNDVPGLTQEEMHQNVITALKLAAPIAEDNGLMLILEPMNIRVDHKGHCLYGSAPAIRICDEVGSPNVKINWDLYHMHITEGDLCGHLREGFEAKQIDYLQLADHPGRNEPGTGEIHYNRVLKEAYDLGYRSFVGLECRPLDDELTAARRVAAADVW